MAGTIIVSSIKTDTDNSFIVRSNTGATLFSVDTTSISIPDGSITSAMIANGTVIAADVADGSITDAKIAAVANTKITGLITGSQLANTAVTAGVYGGSSAIPVVTVDAQGRITSASNTALSTGSMTLLGTLTTTSGTTQTLSGLTLTDYKKLEFVILGVKSTAINFKLQLNDGTSSYNLVYTNTYDVAEGFTGVVTLYLVNGVFGSTVTSCAPSGTYGSSVDYCASGGTRYTTASTSVTFVANTGNFNGGSIKVYGVS